MQISNISAKIWESEKNNQVVTLDGPCWGWLSANDDNYDGADKLELGEKEQMKVRSNDNERCQTLAKNLF